MVKFWAPWCGKCKMIAPHVDELQVEAAQRKEKKKKTEKRSLQTACKRCRRPPLRACFPALCGLARSAITHSLYACMQAKYPGVTVASFDTTEQQLEALAAELGVKGLPQFRFYSVSAAWRRRDLQRLVWVPCMVWLPAGLHTAQACHLTLECCTHFMVAGRQGGAGQNNGVQAATAVRRSQAIGRHVNDTFHAAARASCKPASDHLAWLLALNDLRSILRLACVHSIDGCSLLRQELQPSASTLNAPSLQFWHCSLSCKLHCSGYISSAASRCAIRCLQSPLQHHHLTPRC